MQSRSGKRVDDSDRHGPASELMQQRGQHVMADIPTVGFRMVTDSDIADMAACRLTDPGAGPADKRIAAYFAGQHHPQEALFPRVGYLAVEGKAVIGYVAGHLTRRHGCEGEVQYLFVAPTYRRRGVATALLRLLADWFARQGARKVCVCVTADNPAARPLYESLGATPLKRYWYSWDDIKVLSQ